MASANGGTGDKRDSKEHRETSIGNRLEKVFSSVEQVTSVYFSGLVIAGLVLATVYQVCIRTWMNKSLIGLPEVAEQLVVVIAFTALAVVQRENAHITVDTLRNILMKKRRIYHGVLVFSKLACIGSCVFLLYVLGLFTLHSYQTGHTIQTIYLPVLPFHLAATFGVFLVIIRMIMQLKNVLKEPEGRLKEEKLEYIM